MIKYCAYSEKGIERSANEDRLMVDNRVLNSTRLSGKTNGGFIAVVCDGVGSTSGGAKAAEMITNSFKNFDIEICSPLLVSRHLNKINRKMIEEEKRNNDMNNMASTVAGIIIIDNRFLLFNMGDTRIYKFYNGKLSVMTKDHTVTNHFNHFDLNSNIITCYMGGNGDACFPSFRKGIAENGSIFLACSDGVYKSIDENDIKDILNNDCTIEQKERAILKHVLQNGSKDDRSMVIVKC